MVEEFETLSESLAIGEQIPELPELHEPANGAILGRLDAGIMIDDPHRFKTLRRCLIGDDALLGFFGVCGGTFPYGEGSCLPSTSVL
jgi:hypothetical protein